MEKNYTLTDLIKDSVETIACSKEPDFLINKAKERTPGTIVKGLHKITKPENNVHWTIIHRVDEWWIEQNTTWIAHQYRLIGPGQNSYFSVAKVDKLEKLLNNIVELGKQEKSNVKQNMIIYQIITDENVKIKDPCEKLLLSEANTRFCESKNLSVGFYTVHPLNEKALTPVENYFTNLSLDKETECVVLLGKMGAKSIHIEQKDSSHKNNKTSAGAGIKTKKVDLTANTEFSFLKDNESELEFDVEFTGNSTTFDENLLNNSVWFKNDSQLNGLLESLKSSNKPKSWSYKIKNSQTYNFDFKIAASVLGIVEANIKEEYERASKANKILSVKF